MKNIVFLFLSVFLFSCGVDESIIIGSKSSMLPYGKADLHGWKNINGTSYVAYAAYYKNKILVYLVRNGIVVDYFFSKVIDPKKALKTQLGTSHEEVIRKFGEPAFSLFASDYIEEIQKGSQNDTFGFTYLQKDRDSIFSAYRASSIFVYFQFNSNGKLINVFTYNGGI
jgi:hypothetical protein